MQATIDREHPQPPPTVTPAPATTPAVTEPATTTAATTNDRATTPVYKKWWLWTLVGGVVVAGVVVGVTVGVLAGRDSFNPSLGRVGPAALTVSF
jgi:hypothetical protein